MQGWNSPNFQIPSYLQSIIPKWIYRHWRDIVGHWSIENSYSFNDPWISIDIVDLSTFHMLIFHSFLYVDQRLIQGWHGTTDLRFYTAPGPHAALLRPDLGGPGRGGGVAEGDRGELRSSSWPNRTPVGWWFVRGVNMIKYDSPG